ncbi:unnamed protein product [Cuscuta europaea]|uniref:DUF4371 domain-containing protein n=1 Tax=Cuscuta europaea TaxID=41803 RepID=A0A9P0ZNE8_CUSEU|nr:unnamed protein product [Cuscuta europaea]
MEENKQAHYVHCFAHRLQLVIVFSLKNNGIVGSFFDHLVMIVNVVGASCKRKDDLLQKHYENVVGRIEHGEVSIGKGKNKEKSLVRSGDTRWVSHYKTIIRVVDMWDAVIEVLEAIFDDGVDQKSKSTSSSLIEKMATCEFVFIAHFLLQLLGKTNVLSKELQQKNQNIRNVVDLVKAVKVDLESYRNDYGWGLLVEEVTTFCSSHGIDVPNMKDVK